MLSGLPVRVLIVCACLSAVKTASAQQAAPPSAPVRHWSYSGDTGPEHWGELDPANATCAQGHESSPIDIEGATRVALPPLVFDYHPGQWQIVNNGHSIQVNVPAGSALVVNGQRYNLVQFHFHHPSEEEIAGKHFDMVMHMVHKDADGHLAVVAVLLSDGSANPMIQSLWDRIPAEEGKPQALDMLLDPNKLLPEKQGYYTFMGSLTTPPCSEGVRWFVMKEPMPISVDEEQAFAKMYPNNARPIQPVNGRTVVVSQ